MTAFELALAAALIDALLLLAALGGTRRPLPPVVWRDPS